MLAALSTGASGQQERPAALQEHPELVRDPPVQQEPRGSAGRSKASRASWPESPGKEKPLAPSQEDAATQWRTLREQLYQMLRERTAGCGPWGQEHPELSAATVASRC
ncbi:Mediator Of Dna Damage Checkpoint Protein 1 [Manis pentadactyla]|nr:Mediator Of Dna Damage Checkpoint Protein 1 [Manis pentadactyla]